MSLRFGTILEARYRIENLLGQGGMGAVYRAWDLRLEQWVALKENTLITQEAQQQFKQEAQVLARLRHPNLPRVIDHFITADGVQYLVMDYVDGKNLAEIQTTQNRLTPEEIIHWLDDVCSALTYLHNQHPPVIHRDIKPQNIRITSDGRAVLVDFGLSKVGSQQQRTATGALGVTPGFSPPEQYGAARTDQRSDVYALAATIYALLTGETPPDSVQRAILSATIIPPRELNPGLSQKVERALLHGLETQPTKRPASVQDFQAELDAALRASSGNLAPLTAVRPRYFGSAQHKPAGSDPRPPRVATTGPATRPQRRIPAWIWFAIGGLIVILLLATGVGMMMSGGKDDGGASTTIGVSTGISANATAEVAVAKIDIATKTPTSEPPTPTKAEQQTAGPADEQEKSEEKATSTPEVIVITVVATATPTSEPPTPTPAPPTATPIPPTATPKPKPKPALTPCPPYLHKPKPGMGLLLIENHLGEDLHIDQVGGAQEGWDLAPKQGDEPTRLVLDLPPGKHEFVDNTFHGAGHISVDIQAGSALIVPIWYNDRSEELVYPLEIPNGCR